jgi:hypothetical protein
MKPPHEFTFVVEAPNSASVTEHPGFDLHRPPDAAGPLPVVILVPGPSPAAYPIRPKTWPVYRGYAGLLAARGVLTVITDLPYHDVPPGPHLADELAAAVATIRGLDEVDADRIALWAFSGGALLIGRWLADSPDWLRCLALSYPMLTGDPVAPGRPLILTRAGRELPERQASVDAFLARAKDTATDVRVIDVPDGQHGFDVLDHTEQSRHAVLEATQLVVDAVTLDLR